MDESQNISRDKDEQGKPEENKIETPQIQSADMETHHHPHLHHKPKPWKEYLLEGLMIFVAVTLGFIAENVRENINNREHVRELTAQLLQDLKSDTLLLNKIYQEESEIFHANDTLIALSQEPSNQINIKHLMQLVVISHSMWPFHPSSGAITAIKNELHLKQFSSSKIIGYISDYESHIELLHTEQGITLQYQRSFIDPFLLSHVSAANLKAAFDHLPFPHPEQLSLSQADVSRLGTDMVLVRINTKGLLEHNLRAKADAEKLLQYIKRQYHLEEEN